MERVLVYLLRKNTLPVCAKFTQSVTDYFSSDGAQQLTVSCKLQENRFLISDCVDLPGAELVPLKRAADCPIQHLSPDDARGLPRETLARGIDVGVAVVLQSVDACVLLTRRAAQLSIFPNVWVPPGGHVDPGEQLLEAGLRELREETGLQMSPSECTITTMGLWESVYPGNLIRGLPRRHHIVVYALVQTSLLHQQLQEHVALCVDEVSACAWIDPDTARAIVSSAENAKSHPPISQPPKDIPATFSATVMKGSRQELEALPTSCLLAQVPPSGPDVERVSTGTVYALQLWLQQLHNRKEQH
ncbi:m7GpppN-mRNA hydrolase NUDT17 isoform X1 [Petromyzon marinus]|uniref:m7GpppN-mRNA hydrolase NUDT17 isoform X1 n=1 Tax=Petromyzon marinus TaxID=7757 RepID=UPI003F6F0024